MDSSINESRETIETSTTITMNNQEAINILQALIERHQRTKGSITSRLLKFGKGLD